MNAGTFRLLIPRGNESILDELAPTREVILSRGPWPKTGRNDAFELLFEDDTNTPYFIHLTPNCFDRIPPDSDTAQEWKLAVWILGEDGPQKAQEWVCRYRKVKQIPCLKEWGKE